MNIREDAYMNTYMQPYTYMYHLKSHFNNPTKYKLPWATVLSIHPVIGLGHISKEIQDMLTECKAPSYEVTQTQGEHTVHRPSAFLLHSHVYMRS